MTLLKHYIQDTQTEGGTGGDIYDLDRTQNTDATLLKNVNNASYEIGYEAQMTVNDEPNSTSYSCSVDILSFSGTLSWRYRVQRVNSSNVVQASSGYSTVRDETNTGISTDTLTLTNAFVTGDRLRISFEWKRDADHGNVGITFRVQDADSWVEVDIVLPAVPDHNQRAFRIRSTDPAINANGGGDWEAAENTDASIDLDTLFRIRFEVEETEGSSDGGVTYKLQYRVNTGGGYGAWTDVPVGTSPTSSPLADTWPPAGDEFEAHTLVMIVASSTFTHEAATTDILTTTSGSFVAGDGLHDNSSPSITLNAQHTELEWSLVLSRYYDGDPATGDVGDLFQFRVVETDSTVFTGDTNSGYDNIPEITCTLAVGHMGGTYIEQPSQVGPFKDGNGNLYAISEHSNNTNLMLLHKSTDGGDTWAEATLTGRPTAPDPEGIDILQEGDVLHILTRRGNDVVQYHRYRMSSHASADTWEIIDREVDANAGAPVDTASEACSIVKRVGDDDFIFCIYNGRDGASHDTIWVTRSEDNGATFETRIEMDAVNTDNYTGVKAVYHPTDSSVHAFVKDNPAATIYHFDMASGGTAWSTRTSVATDAGTVGQTADNIVPPVAYDDGGVAVVMVGWQSLNATLSTRTVRDGTLQTTVTGASDNDVHRSSGASHQPVANFAVDGKTVHLLYSHQTDFDIFTDDNIDEGGWGVDTELQDAVTCHYVRSQRFVHSSGNGGDTVVGYFWDNGSDGQSGGFARYDEIVLAVGGAVYPPFPRRPRRLVRM